MFKVGKLFKRNRSTLWTIGEEEALLQVDPSDKELALLKNYYSGHFPKEEDYRRRNLQKIYDACATLILNNPTIRKGLKILN